MFFMYSKSKLIPDWSAQSKSLQNLRGIIFSEQIVGPIDKEVAGDFFSPKSRIKTWSSGLWKDSFLISLAVKQKIWSPPIPSANDSFAIIRI